MDKDRRKQKDDWQDDDDAFFGGDPKNADRLQAKLRDKQKREILRQNKNRDEEFNPRA